MLKNSRLFRRVYLGRADTLFLRAIDPVKIEQNPAVGINRAFPYRVKDE